MSKVTTTHCDACGAVGALTFQYFEYRSMDGAGSMENNYGQIDLCHKHTLDLLCDIDKHASRAPTLSLIEGMRRMGKKVRA